MSVHFPSEKIEEAIAIVHHYHPDCEMPRIVRVGDRLSVYCPTCCGDDGDDEEDDE